MRNQAITFSSLNKSIYVSDLHKFDFLKTKLYREQSVIEALKISIDPSHIFTLNAVKSDSTDQNKINYFMPVFHEKLLLRKCAKNISRAFEVRSNDRHKSLRELLACLRWGPNQKVYRIDLKKYYESIPSETLCDFIVNSKKLSEHTKGVVMRVLKQFWINNDKGLPRGIEISNPLANALLYDLDSLMVRQENCLYYSRFVDDIIIVTTGIKNDTVLRDFKDNLPAGLFFNTSKTHKLDKSKKEIEFPFLGYKIVVAGATKDGTKNYRNVDLHFSKTRETKVKSRIYSAFEDFLINDDMELLLDRLTFLSSNRTFKRGKGKYKAGLFYNNRLANSSESAKGIDCFIYALVKNQGLGSIKGRLKLTGEQQKKIFKINFESRFNSRFHSKFNYFRNEEVTRIWL